MEKGIFDVCYSRSIDLQKITGSFLDSLFDLLASRKTEEYVRHNVERFIDANSDKQMGEIIESAFGIGEEKIIETLSGYILSVLAREETADWTSGVVTDLIMHLLSGMGERPLGEVLALEQETRERFDSFLHESLLDVMDSRLPGVIESFNIRQIVVDKIDSLDVASVEKLLLMVIARHLKWINVFGALIGALIGLSQVVMRLFIDF